MTHTAGRARWWDRRKVLGSAAVVAVLAAGTATAHAATTPGRADPAPATGVTLPAALPANAVDPGEPGPYRTVRGSYRLDDVRLPGFPREVEMAAEVVAPRGAPGPRPLVVFLHGVGGACYLGDQVETEWPCADGRIPVPNERGYLPAQELLASQGYVTVSIAANGIHGQPGATSDSGDEARSGLVRQHLRRWAAWSRDRSGAPPIVRDAPPADPARVLLVGHSRGGEGVSRAAMDTLSPPPADQDGAPGPVGWTIRGVLLIAPTLSGMNPVPDVPSVTILPGCDGDLTNLQGQQYVDATRGVGKGAALHGALYVIGANHNFFNTEWTPGLAAAPAHDDWYDEADPVCGASAPARLTAAEQQRVGATYVAAAARLFVEGDDRVRPLLDGSGRRAPSADPARVLSHALGGARTSVLTPGPDVTVTGDARICEQVAATDDAATACVTGEGRSPHFVPAPYEWTRPEPGRHAVRLDWTSAGRAVTVAPAGAPDLTGARELALRVIVPTNSTGTRLGVAVVDAAGRRTELGDVLVDGLPAGSGSVSALWAQEVRVPVRGVSGRIAKLELTPRSATGTAWLVDAWGWRPGTPDPRPGSLPRIDLGSAEVAEGDSGTRTHQIPVRVSGSGTGRVRLFLVGYNTGAKRTWTAEVRPGQTAVPVPIDVDGDTRWAGAERWQLFAKAEQGVVVGDYDGTLDVLNDDPEPSTAVTAVAGTVAEGAALTWRLTLSAPAESDRYTSVVLRAPAAGAELSTADVDPAWLQRFPGGGGTAARPLSEAGLWLQLTFPAGTTTADLTIPTITDGEAEPDEFVEFEVAGATGLAPVTGTVTDVR